MHSYSVLYCSDGVCISTICLDYIKVGEIARLARMIFGDVVVRYTILVCSLREADDPQYCIRDSKPVSLLPVALLREL